MEKEMSGGLRNLFLIHLVVSAVIGIPLWFVPGRTLLAVGWVPEMRTLSDGLTVPGTVFVDPLLARLVGAGLLAMAFSSYLGWRSNRWVEVAQIVQFEAVFGALGIVGILATVIRTSGANKGIPVFGWVLLVILVVFTAAWGWAWRQHTGQ